MIWPYWVAMRRKAHLDAQLPQFINGLPLVGTIMMFRYNGCYTRGMKTVGFPCTVAGDDVPFERALNAMMLENTVQHGVLLLRLERCS